MAGDLVDIEEPHALLRYLRASGRLAPDERVTTRVLAGGVSNKTVLVERPSSQSWVIKQALAKLRVQVDWFSDPRRIEREALGLTWLQKLAPRGSITPLIFLDESQNLLTMAAVPEPHENWKTVLLSGHVDMSHVSQFARLLGEIHKNAHERREEIAAIFDDRSFFESLRIEPYYEYSAQQVPEAADFLRQLIAQTRMRRLTLVHGDYSPKNILLHDGQLILLDHEVIHWGDPAFDCGFALTHLLSKAHHLRSRRGAFLEAAVRFWNEYVPWSGELEAFSVRHTLACLLARVAGRSPLEYLDDEDRRRQHRVVLQLMRQPPSRIEQLVEQFGTSLKTCP